MPHAWGITLGGRPPDWSNPGLSSLQPFEAPWQPASVESIAHNHSGLSAHIAFNLGMARSRCGELEGALDALSRVVETKPDHTLAMDAAACCAFSPGNEKMGRRLAKQANELGHSETYRDWKEGKYHRGNDP